jgi:hypothetical protein
MERLQSVVCLVRTLWTDLGSSEAETLGEGWSGAASGAWLHVLTHDLDDFIDVVSRLIHKGQWLQNLGRVETARRDYQTRLRI